MDINCVEKCKYQNYGKCNLTFIDEKNIKCLIEYDKNSCINLI